MAKSKLRAEQENGEQHDESQSENDGQGKNKNILAFGRLVSPFSLRGIGAHDFSGVIPRFLPLLFRWFTKLGHALILLSKEKGLKLLEALASKA